MGDYSELETIGLICAIALVVAVVLWRILARSSSARQRGASLRLALDRLEGDREESWLEFLEKDHSPFVQFFRFAQKELGAKNMEEAPEMNAALHRLREAISRYKERDPGAPTDGNEKTTGDQKSTISAAALTIVREIYGRPEWVDQLSEEGRREMDRLVDGLTEEP